MTSNTLNNGWMRRMFDSVSDEYVILNKVLTFGQDNYWRSKLLQNIKPNDGDKMLDICTGTGDLAIKLATQFPNAKVYAMDFSPNMLSTAERRANKLGIKSIVFKETDCTKMDFADESFDYVTISFGFRNISFSKENLTRALGEIYRVLKHNGRFAVIETSQPKNPFIKKLFHIYARRVVPSMGVLVSGKSKPYAYLGGSIVRFFNRDELAERLSEAGFQKEKMIPFLFGGILLSVFKKGDKI